MALVVLDRDEQRRIIKRRQKYGHDRFDEVWDGVYFMSPIANNEHQGIGTGLTVALFQAVERVVGARVFGGCNVGDREAKWTKNYRVPHVAVVLPGNPAQDRGTHWFGGPDFVVEVLSPGDRARKKFGFYAKIGTREVLLVCRKPWALELYRLIDGELKLVGKAGPDPALSLESDVQPISLRLLPGDPRPTVEATQTGDARTWLI